MAGGKGLEPLFAGPEPAVLPLNDPPASSAHTFPDPLPDVKENLVSWKILSHAPMTIPRIHPYRTWSPTCAMVLPPISTSLPAYAESHGLARG